MKGGNIYIIAFFYLISMANCRISKLKPPCGYRLEGVAEILFLDFDDFRGFAFEGDDLYSNCRVTAIRRNADFIEVDAPDGAKYSSAFNSKVYAHTLETFIGELSAEMSKDLHLATKRRQIPVFKLKNGKYYTFGYEAGAIVTYVNQTAESIGAVVTVTAASIYPLFEVQASALTTPNPSEYVPDFDNGAYCEIE